MLICRCLHKDGKYDYPAGYLLTRYHFLSMLGAVHVRKMSCFNLLGIATLDLL